MLWVLSFVFAADRICTVYEMAVKTEPSNEELLSHLFMAYVRIGDYKNQQQTAMKLYKLKPKNPYYFWAVMSHVMQVCSCWGRSKHVLNVNLIILWIENEVCIGLLLSGNIFVMLS